MVDDTEKSSLEKIVDALAAEGVEFLVVGGQAEAPFRAGIAIRELRRRATLAPSP
jgi:hypothetical protein